MPKNTVLLLLFLVLVSSLLLGINIGKKIGKSLNNQAGDNNQIRTTSTPWITPIPSPTTSLIPRSSSSGSSTQVVVSGNTSTFTDENCGFSLSYDGTYMNQNTVDGGSSISTDPDDPAAVIVTTCQQEIPKPPLTPDMIENIVVDGGLTII